MFLHLELYHSGPMKASSSRWLPPKVGSIFQTNCSENLVRKMLMNFCSKHGQQEGSVQSTLQACIYRLILYLRLFVLNPSDHRRSYMSTPKSMPMLVHLTMSTRYVPREPFQNWTTACGRAKVGARTAKLWKVSKRPSDDSSSGQRHLFVISSALDNFQSLFIARSNS
jgi:hypothetical protein